MMLTTIYGRKILPDWLEDCLLLASFSVAKATLEWQMSVCMSVCLSQKPLSLLEFLLLAIEPINHRAYRPLSLLTIKPIDHQAYQPSKLSTIEPIDHRAYRPLSLSTIKPIDR